MQPKYTTAQWEQFSPALDGLAGRTVAMAKAVLVNGDRPVDVAQAHASSRQNVYAAVKKVQTVLEKNGADALVPVMVWLPPELAKQVQEMAKPYETPAKKTRGKKKTA